jgi:hypothetical protein
MLQSKRASMSGAGRWAALAPLLLVIFMLAAAVPRQAAAAMFVGDDLSDVAVEKRVVVAHPQPVQLLVQFLSKGAPSAAATKQVKPLVLEAVKTSGLFSDVTDASAPNGAILNVVIENVISPADLKDAKSQGFATGATLFIAGSTVRDHYVCTIDYISSPGAAKITRSAKHVLIMQLGLINSPPQNAVKIDGGAKQAIAVMVRQIVSNPLNDLAADPAFATPAVVEPPSGAPSPDPAAASPPPAAPVDPPATTPSDVVGAKS